MNDIKVCISDWETYRELSLVCCYLPHTGEKTAFEISKRKNDLYAYVKFLKEGDFEYILGFNNISFDSQVDQFVLDSYESWIDLDNLQICEKIYEFTQRLIDDQNYDIGLPYREKHLENKQIDLFKIMHYDNKSRRTSLKWIEFSLDMDIEVLPIYHGKVGLTEEDIERVIEYCWKDINATHELYKVVRGETEHKEYKGKDKIQLRFDVKQEFDLPQESINWNDVKIGAELNKKFYKELTKKTDKDIWILKKNRKPKTGFTFGECFPSYWEFKTKEFKDFFDIIYNTKVNLNTKQEFRLKVNNNTFVLGKGGSHSCETARLLQPTDNQVLVDIDVASMYPNAIRKRKLYPSHLGPKWNEAYCSNIPRRIEAKQRYKEGKNKKYDNLQETFKLSLNGSFGRLIDKYDWQYDPFAGMCVTIGSQVDIMMLVEMFVMEEGIEAKSLNTDGVVLLVNKDKVERCNEICRNWEKIVGNDLLGKLEDTEYESLIQLSVNDYIAIKKGEKDISERLKFKGDNLIFHELHKNKSRRIIPLALKEYFVNGKLPEDTVNNHRNIFDFCIGVKASSNFYYEGINRDNGEVKKYDKLIRYYVSTEGEKLYKVKKEGVDTRAPERRECEAGVPYQTLFNTVIKHDNFDDYKINKDYYISKIYNLIGKIDAKVKRDRNNKENGVLTLF